MYLRFFFTLCVVLGLHQASYAESEPSFKKLNLAATAWCPYVCEDENDPGFITTFMDALLSEHDIELDVTVLPWSRAIKEARSGQYDGLLTAVEGEVSDFYLPTVATGFYQDCLFKRSDSNLVFTDRDSLKGLKLGGIKDYGYGSPIGEVFENPNSEESIYLVSSDSPLDQLTGMLSKGRIDLFVEDKNVLANFVSNSDKSVEVSQAGCLQELPLFTAISPGISNGEEWIERLEFVLNSEKAASLYQQAKQASLGPQ